jgi:hypothetical protein
MGKVNLISVIAVVVLVAVCGVFWLRMGEAHKGSEDTNGKLTRTDQSDARKVSKMESATGRSSAGKLVFAYTENLLSDAVRSLLGLDGNVHNYNTLKAAISKLSKDLSKDDVAALRTLLHWPNDQFPEQMRGIEVNAVKNDVLDRLLRQNTLPENMGEQMVSMASDTDNDPVWRDYCVQFMSAFYERVSEESEASQDAAITETDSSEDELKAVREAMFASLDERDSTIAGTSLIGLELLSRTHDEVDRDQIISKASDIAADESASAESRMTALRMSTLTGADGSTARIARNLAQTGQTVLLRSAAIVTLGETGSEEDRELIESFLGSSDRQIAMAAEMALKKMDARN